jgi:DNA-binding transcriptional ArsR family regulator
MNRTPLKDVLAVTKALSDPQRVRMYLLLQGGELCVCQIVAVLKLATSTISKHLSILADAGLIDLRKDGRWVYYRQTEPASAEDASMLAWLRKSLERDAALKADRAALATVKKQPLEILCRQQRPAP